MKSFVSTLVMLMCFCLMKAQEKLGITNSNYSSSNSIFLNASSSVDSRVYMQLNIAGANAHIYNNGAYLPAFSFWSLKNAANLASPKFSTSNRKKFAYANAGIEGPVFVMSKGSYGFGLFVRARMAVDVRNIPKELTELLLQNFNVNTYQGEQSIDLKNVKASGLAWAEYGINFGKMIKKQRKEIVSVGGNLKYLTGINFFFANIERLKGFYNDTIIQVDEVNAKLRYNQPAIFSGKGFGLDVGVNYKRMLKNVDSYYSNSKQSNCRFIDYEYKASVSLRDFGYIKFTNAPIRADLNASGTARLDTGAVLTQSKLVSDFQALLTNGNTNAFLPASLSAQFDYNFGNHLYVNATLIKNLLPLRWVGVQSPNLISVCPRYEFRNFELAMPFSLQKFLYPQLGFAFRIRTFVLGLDNVLPVFFKSNTRGLGVYVNLGWSLYKNPACRVGHSSIADCPPNTFTKNYFLKKKKRGGKRGNWKIKKKPNRAKLFRSPF